MSRRAAGCPRPTIANRATAAVEPTEPASPAEADARNRQRITVTRMAIPRITRPPRTIAAAATSPPDRNGTGKELVSRRHGRHVDGAGSRRRSPTRLLEIVRDRTGYPIETLGLDLDIEADLGIDSIKRVEILGKLRDEFPALEGPVGFAGDDGRAGAGPHARRDRRPHGGAWPDTTGERPGPHGSRFRQSPHVPVGRLDPVRMAIGNRHDRRVRSGGTLLEAVDAPLPLNRAGLMPGGRIVITDDGRGVAAELANRLEAAGVAVERIGRSRITGRLDLASRPSTRCSTDCDRAVRSPGSCTHCRSASAHRVRRIGGDWSRRDRRRRQGAVPAGEGHGRRPGIRRAARAERA